MNIIGSGGIARLWGVSTLACALLSLGIAAGWPSPAAADAKGRFEVSSAYTTLRDGVYYLNAQISYDLPPKAEEALESGVTLNLEVQIEVERSRRFRTDKQIADLRQRYSIQYHALSERYIVRNLNSGEQTSFASLTAAEERLGVLSDIPVLDSALLTPGARHYISLRAVLDIRRLPVPLRLFAAFLDDWRVASKWFTWRLSSTE